MNYNYDNTFQDAKLNALSQLKSIWKWISFFSISVTLVLIILLLFFNQNILLVSVFLVSILIGLIASISSYQTRKKLISGIEKLSLDHSIKFMENNIVIVEEGINKISIDYSKINSIYKERVNRILKQKGKFFELICENTQKLDAIIIFGDFESGNIKINEFFSIKSLTNFLVLIPEKTKEFEEELQNRTKIKSIQKLSQ